jgi:hypothetical protein
LAQIRRFFALIARLIGRRGGGERCGELTLKAIHGGTAFRSQQAQAVFCVQGGDQHREKEIGRLWGISGGFLDLAAVIVEIAGIEAGCWRGDFMIGRVFKDGENPAFQDVGLHLGRQR